MKGGIFDYVIYIDTSKENATKKKKTSLAETVQLQNIILKL